MDAEAKMAEVTRDAPGTAKPCRPVRWRTARRLAPKERMPQILDAALEEFAERGYGGARMAAVAERPGSPRG